MRKGYEAQITATKYTLTINTDCAKIEQCKKVKRRIVDWLFKYAHDEEVYEIAKLFNIKTD